MKKGRPVGSTDTVAISIEQLLKYLPPTTVIQVRRKWLEMVEELHHVKFVDNQPAPSERSVVTPIAEELASESPPEQEAVASAAEAEVRPRLDISAAEESID